MIIFYGGSPTDHFGPCSVVTLWDFHLLHYLFFLAPKKETNPVYLERHAGQRTRARREKPSRSVNKYLKWVKLIFTKPLPMIWGFLKEEFTVYYIQQWHKSKRFNWTSVTRVFEIIHYTKQSLKCKSFTISKVLVLYKVLLNILLINYKALFIHQYTLYLLVVFSLYI